MKNRCSSVIDGRSLTTHIYLQTSYTSNVVCSVYHIMMFVDVEATSGRRINGHIIRYHRYLFCLSSYIIAGHNIIPAQYNIVLNTELRHFVRTLILQ